MRTVTELLDLIEQVMDIQSHYLVKDPNCVGKVIGSVSVRELTMVAPLCIWVTPDEHNDNESVAVLHYHKPFNRAFIYPTSSNTTLTYEKSVKSLITAKPIEILPYPCPEEMYFQLSTVESIELAGMEFTFEDVERLYDLSTKLHPNQHIRILGLSHFIGLSDDDYNATINTIREHNENNN